MDKKLKCAVVGLGLLGIRHVEFLRNFPKTKLIAVCDIRIEKIRDFSNKFKVATYTDYKEMYKNEHIDLVIVATQDPYHKEPVVEACKAKIPYIICEKPLATTVSDASEMLEAAEKNNIKVYVFFPNRFYPLDNAIRLVVKNGYIGTPSYGEMRLDDNISVPINLWGESSKLWASISSPAHFLLSHAIDLLRFYFEPQEVSKVYAIGKSGIVGSSVDYVDSYLTFTGGLTIRLKSEWSKYMKPLIEFYIQITGVNGGFVYNKTPGFGCRQGLRFDFNCKEEDIMERQKLLYSEGIKSNVTIASEGINRNSLELYADEDEGNVFDWYSGIGRYVDAMLGESNEMHRVTNIMGGYYQVKVVDALLKSISTGREVDISY